MTRVTPASTCVPHTRQPKQAVLRSDGLGRGILERQQRQQQQGSAGSKVGWDRVAGTWAPDLGGGQVPPDSNQASEPGASLPLKPGVWGQVPHPALETRLLDSELLEI